MNIRRFLTQAVVYWPPTGRDAHGNITYGAPVAYKARIITKSNVKDTPVSDIVRPESTVLTADYMAPQGMIAEKSLADLKPDNSPAANDGVEITTVLPFVGRAGGRLGWELTTAKNIALQIGR